MCVLVCTRRNCYIASMEFNNTVCCNLIGSDRFLLVPTKPWQVLPDVFFPPPHRAHAHSGKYAHRKKYGWFTRLVQGDLFCATVVICVVHVVVKWIEPTPISVAYMIFSGGGGGGC